MKYLRPFVLFMVGFCVYITIEVCFRGFSYPLMGVCGGVILLIIDSLNERISWNMDLLVQGCIGSLVATLFEFVIGGICLLCNFNLMWDYSNMPFNLFGVVCLPFSLLWIPISIVGIFIADAINYYVFDRLPTPYYKVCGKIIVRFKEKNRC